MSAQSTITDLQLERLALGELSPVEKQDLEARVAVDAGARERLAEIERDSAAFAISHPVEAGRAEIGRRAGRDLTPRPRRFTAALAVAVPALGAAGLLLIVGRTPPVGTVAVAPVPLEETRLKGLLPKLLVFQKPAQPAGGGDVAALGDGATVHPHDVLQVGYVAAGRRYGALLSIDGGGNVTVHAPAPGQAALLDPVARVLLPTAYELDDAPAFERFFLLTSARPIALEAVTAAARALGADPQRAASSALPVPAGVEQTSILLRKTAAPGAARKGQTP